MLARLGLFSQLEGFIALDADLNVGGFACCGDSGFRLEGEILVQHQSHDRALWSGSPQRARRTMRTVESGAC